MVIPLPEGELPADNDGINAPETGRGFDPLIRAEVILPHKAGEMMAKVIVCKRDSVQT